MMARLARHLAGEFRRMGREDSGVALMMTLAVFLMLYILCCGVYATADIIHQRTQLQNACDAAAYSAAVVQADGLSRMAVVNRAMAWTYIQLCREQMDYIVYSWLRLTLNRFVWDWANKVKTAGIEDGQHYNFADISPIIEFLSEKLFLGFWRGGLRCKYGCHGKEDDGKGGGCGSFIGVEDSAGQRYSWYVSVNGRTDNAKDFVPVDNDDPQKITISNVVEKLDKEGWPKATMERIQHHKKSIVEMNQQLVFINHAMRTSIQKTVEFVLFQNLPRNGKGGLEMDDMKDFYWAMAGGMSAAPEGYRRNGFIVEEEDDEEGGETGSYFDVLSNTEEDELQFLTMADGVPGQWEGAPGWMKGRPVVLSDYFGLGEGDEGNPTEPHSGLERYIAAGLDQWFVRGTTEEVMSEIRPVKKGFRDPPGGIQRVYKHSNREEGGQWRVRIHYRPNHIFRGDANVIGNMKFSEWVDFIDVRGRLNDILPGNYAVQILEGVGDVFSGGAATGLMEGLRIFVEGIVGGLIDNVIDQLNSQLKSVVEKFVEIPPSNEHTQERFPDQCHNVNESTGLVSQYEWGSAYWMCPWAEYRSWSLFGGWGSWHKVKEKHYRLPVAEFLGCSAHGYGEWMSWLLQEPLVLGRGGSTRSEYRSCFINFDGTRDMERNTHLRGYARIYGDDQGIFDTDPDAYDAYVGAVACPWILGESFFNGDGTILVGLARRQRNPFRKWVANAVKLLEEGKDVEHPSIYEPFSPQPGADRFLIGLSAARAVWAPRPDHPVTGMESMNGGVGRLKGQGQYEPRYDAVTDHYRGKLSENIEENSYKSAHMGCLCGKPDTQDRLLRMWNLSQTDWDGALLPLRHAFGSHTYYDSRTDLGAGTSWEFDDPDQNSVDKLMARLVSLDWECIGVADTHLTSDEIFALPFPLEPSSPYRDMKYGVGWEWDWDDPRPGGSPSGERGTLKQLFVYRRLL